jgi:ATP-dependent exoDNAse (exonuclease V) beta subunit
MPTDKHRVAAYLPKEVDEKFQVFKTEREVGDSQALILIVSEFLRVSREVTHSNDSLLTEKIQLLGQEIEDLRLDINLLGELKSELLLKIEQEALERNNKISELKSDLLNNIKSELFSELKSELSKQSSTDSFPVKNRVIKKSSKSKPKKQTSERNNTELLPNGLDILTTSQLVERLKGVERNNTISTKKYNMQDKPEKFIEWSKSLDPDGYGWEFREGSILFYRVKPLA